MNDVTSPWQADWNNLNIAHSASCTSIFCDFIDQSIVEDIV